MTLYQFRLLPENDQALTTWHGAFLLTREDRSHRIALYKVHDFFVEVYYDSATNEVAKFNPFDSPKRLYLYFGTQLN